MRLFSRAPMLILFSLTAAAQEGSTPPRLVSAELPEAPWNVLAGGIAAYEVTVDEKGTVTAADIVQDVAPFGEILGKALLKWRFDPAQDQGLSVRSRVLVLGFFRPPVLLVVKPEHPRYKNTVAPDDIPWPTSIVVPPYPPNVLGHGKMVLEVDISERGQATSVRVVSPPSPFDGASVQTARQWIFRPARRSGQAVPSRAFVVFCFLQPAL